MLMVNQNVLIQLLSLHNIAPEVTQEQIKADLKRFVIDAALPAEFVDENTKYFINPTGRS